MVSLLDCPAELRQQVLGYCLPPDVHGAGAAPRTAALLPLLLTCRAVRLDVLQLLGTWSPLYHIEDPDAITTPPHPRRHDGDAGEPQMRRISLRLFAGLDLARMRSAAPMGTVQGVFDVQPWLRCAASLPRATGGAIESVTIDLTPVPAWMSARRPDWVRANVLDARNRAFLDGCAPDVRELVGALRRSLGAGVRVQLGGVVPRKARRVVEDMMGPAGAESVGFGGEWLSGPREVPTRLSLGLVCRCWGIELDEPGVNDWRYDLRTVQIRNEARKEGLTAPDLDLRPLSPVCWSRNSSTAYYVNAQEDEGRTRGDLVRLLAFAAEARTGGAPLDATVDFAPAIRARRFLVHCLARDLGLASVSVEDAGEKFVRVSRAVEAVVDEHELPEGDGGGGGGGGGEESCAHREEDSTSSRTQETRLQGLCGSCCCWAPFKRLFHAAGDR